MIEPDQYYQHNRLGVKTRQSVSKVDASFLAKKLISPSTIVEQSSDVLQVRYKVLSWELYNELFGQLPELAVDERARIKGRQGNTKAELRKDFPHPFVE